MNTNTNLTTAEKEFDAKVSRKFKGVDDMSVVKTKDGRAAVSLRFKKPAVKNKRTLQFEARCRNVVSKLNALVFSDSVDGDAVRIERSDLKKLLSIQALDDVRIEEFETTCWENDMVCTHVEGCFVLTPVARMMQVPEVSQANISAMLISLKA